MSADEKNIPPSDEAFVEGLSVRKAVLGAAHVERSLANATEFTRDFQEMITRTVWGGIWTRPGLDHRTRRLLVVTMTAALGRWEEFELHVRAGLRERGFSIEELKETLLQIAIYAGVPAANTAFKIANAAAEELGEYLNKAPEGT